MIHAQQLSAEPLKLTGLQPKTWRKRVSRVVELVASDVVAGIVLYMPTDLFLQASRTEYQPIFDELLLQMTKAKSIVFVFEDNLAGNFAMRDYETKRPVPLRELEEQHERATKEGWSEWSMQKLEMRIARQRDADRRKDEIAWFTKQLLSSGVPVSPFYIRSDVTIRLQEFLQELDQGVFLRLYVPNARYQADQLQSLIKVLERYLAQVEGSHFAVDLQKTPTGTVYVFKTQDGPTDLKSLDAAVSRFDEFMKQCGDDPTAAEAVLRAQGTSDDDATYLVARYARDYQRLMLDVKHELEHKRLLLRHRLENDLIEIGSGFSPQTLQVQGPSALLGLSSDPRPVAISVDTINVVTGDQIVTRADQIVNGGINYTTQDREIMHLLLRFADRLEALQLRSDLDQLKDPSTPEPAKLTGKQRLVAFLHRAATKAGEVTEKIAVETLSKYLESLLSGKP